ncbi:MAG: type II toxin-antitoxin system ParD family antitoxin [Merismopedia sp. SIO2A8]|nr:type II toxin-antitoxin system ParD family antitoxin [Merismopedia sp. SIO2A8]
MNITLTPDQAALIQQQIHSGQFETVNQAIEAALQLLDKRLQYDRWVKDTQQKIDLATDQLARGEGVDGEEAIAQLRAKLRQSK